MCMHQVYDIFVYYIHKSMYSTTLWYAFSNCENLKNRPLMDTSIDRFRVVKVELEKHDINRHGEFCIDFVDTSMYNAVLFAL